MITLLIILFIREQRKENMRASINRLSTTSSSYKPSAQEIRRDKTLQYSKYDDAKECSFKPCINGSEKVRIIYSHFLYCVIIDHNIYFFFSLLNFFYHFSAFNF